MVMICFSAVGVCEGFQVRTRWYNSRSDLYTFNDRTTCRPLMSVEMSGERAPNLMFPSSSTMYQQKPSWPTIFSLYIFPYRRAINDNSDLSDIVGPSITKALASTMKDWATCLLCCDAMVDVVINPCWGLLVSCVTMRKTSCSNRQAMGGMAWPRGA